MEQKQTIPLVVKNHPGVFLRITGLFTRRGFNIDSLTAFPDEKKEFTTMTITTYGDDATAKQIIRQVNKVQEVVASDLKAGEA